MVRHDQPCIPADTECGGRRGGYIGACATDGWLVRPHSETGTVRSADDSFTVTSPVPADVWESVLKSDGAAVVTQSLPWRDAVLATGRFADVSRLYEFGSGRQVVLPLVQRRGVPLRAATLASWPQVWSAGGPICTDGAASAGEAHAVLRDLAAIGALAVELRLRHDAGDCWLDAAGPFRAEPAPYWVLDLDGGAGEVWERRFRGAVRRAVHKAERSGVEIESDRTGRLLGEFWELYQKSVVRWARSQHAPAWLTRRRLASTTNPDRLARVAQAFGQDCTTWLARHEGRPVAARIVLRAGGYAKGWQAAMDKELIASLGGVSQLLDWRTIEDACQDGYRYFDLGFARPGSSIGAYKERLGAHVVNHHTLRAERLPVQAASRLPRELVKKAIGFQDNT